MQRLFDLPQSLCEMVHVCVREAPAMPKRIRQEQQLEFFSQFPLYLSQSDAAKALGVTVRVVQYWETQGLIHPELPLEGRTRRYTSRDLVELKFIKSLVVDQGYQVPSLVAKLAFLDAPYDYDPLDIFWDPRAQSWKSRSELAGEHLQNLRETLEGEAAAALRQLTPLKAEEAAPFLLDFLRDRLLGKGNSRSRKARSKT